MAPTHTTSGVHSTAGAAPQAAGESPGPRTAGAEPTPQVLEAYRELKDRTESWG